MASGDHPNDEAALIRASQAGDRNALATLVTRHAPSILSVTSRMLGSGPDAEDVAQETFAAACRGISRFRFGSKFSTWLYGIALNKCRDALRARRPDFVSFNPEDDQHAAVAWLASTDGGPDRELEHRALAGELERAVQALPPHYRESFILRHVEGLDYDEMSAIVGTARDTLKMRVYKARTLLAESLAHLEVERR